MENSQIQCCSDHSLAKHRLLRVEQSAEEIRRDTLINIQKVALLEEKVKSHEDSIKAIEGYKEDIVGLEINLGNIKVTMEQLMEVLNKHNVKLEQIGNMPGNRAIKVLETIGRALIVLILGALLGSNIDLRGL